MDRINEVTLAAEECAQEAWRNKTIDHEGQILVARHPEGGDWECLEEECPGASEEERQAFDQIFAEQVRDLLEQAKGWRPTHRLRVPVPGCQRPVTEEVMLDDGVAYTLDEWAFGERPDYAVEDGRWTFQGQPFCGEVEPI
uniref:Uncharacterized protein n=1 Tax=viral metagenome TaxID=1070528 RepID=A0A6M3M069_9ZZZZ